MMLFIGTGIYEIPSEQFSLKLDRHAEILSENFATEHQILPFEVWEKTVSWQNRRNEQCNLFDKLEVINKGLMMESK